MGQCFRLPAEQEAANGSSLHGKGSGDVSQRNFSRGESAQDWLSIKPKKQKLEDQFEVKEKLGEGATAVVNRGIDKKSGREVAIKIFLKNKMDREDKQALVEEVTILSNLQHNNVITFYDFLEDQRHFYLIMELVQGGELFDRIVQKTTYTEKEARDVFKLVVTAIAYCHGASIVHRDLKLENLLLRDPNDDVTAVIADFGFAARHDGTEPTLYKQCGTPSYMAPEIIRGELYNKAVDMWSLGVITYILLGGYPPFSHKNQMKLFSMIKKGEYDFEDEYWSHVSAEAKDLIKRMLCLDPAQRLTAEQALQHPWVLLDDATLESRGLEKTKVELKKFNARRKFRAALKAVMATQQLSAFMERIKEQPITPADLPPVPVTTPPIVKEEGRPAERVPVAVGSGGS